MIDGVFFDGDQTLWDFEALMRRALAVTLMHLRAVRPGPRSDGLDVETMVADRAVVAAPQHDQPWRLEQRRLAAFERTLARIGLRDPELAAELNSYYLKERFTDVRLFEDVVPVLTRLRSRMPLGLLSNGNGYPERSGLAGMFTAVVLSDDHGVAKPDRRLFDIATAALGVQPVRLAMVGDSIDHDVAGAQRAGWHGLWLNRARRPLPPDVTPDGDLASLHELPAALARL